MIAESSDTVIVEGNHYFPIDSVIAGALEPTEHSSHCPWKGDASYFDVSVGGERNANAAFTYPAPKDAAAHIKDRVAFWRGVVVTAE